MKIKIVSSLSIFIFLFSSAWLLEQHQNHLESKNHKLESNVNDLNTVPINYDNSQLNTNLYNEISNVHWELHKSFKPREYVRILKS